MKTAILTVALIFSSSCAFAAVPPNPKNFKVIGQWSGKGSMVGKPFSACAVFSPYMSNAYLHLDYSLRFNESPNVTSLHQEAFYYFLANGSIEGVSLDNQSNTFQIIGEYAPNVASNKWLKAGKEIGATQWQLSTDGNTLTFSNFGLLKSGELMQIGEVSFTRMASGKSCK